MRMVSTAGVKGERPLRRLRRQTVADVLARFISQTTGSARLLVEPGADGAADPRLVKNAIEVLHRLPTGRLAASDDQLTLQSNDLLKSLLHTEGRTQWPEAVLSGHRDVIGESRGALVRFARTDGGPDIEVFTTRPDTLFGLSFVAVSPGHAAAASADSAQLEAFRSECLSAGEESDVKIGMPLGLSVRHPFVPGRTVPVWLANFVVEGYGTGAAGGCPACDQRDFDFARRYGLSVIPIVATSKMDPAQFEAGQSAHAGDGTIVNSGFLDGLSVPQAIERAIARLVELDRGRPFVQYRPRSLVIAQAAPSDADDVRYLDRCWRFADSFLTAVTALSPVVPAPQRHVLHVSTPEAVNRHLLDARLLWRALGETGEPWEEIVLVGDVREPTTGEFPTPDKDALRLAILADTPPDRELDWTETRQIAALRVVEGARRALASPPFDSASDDVHLAGKLTKPAATLEGALRRRRINMAVAAVREIVAVLEAQQVPGLKSSAQDLVKSLLHSMLPGLAREGAGGTPPWPPLADQASVAGRIELIVQINGRKRGAVCVQRDADEQRVMTTIRADPVLGAQLGKQVVRKIVVVPNRLVNLVI